jgi:CrcB protein
MTPVVIAATLVAGAFGAVVRYLLARAFATRGPFPFAVLIVNVVGSAIGGAVLALAVRGDVSVDIRFVLISGLCGGLTTFSTWTVESVQLVLAGKTGTAVMNVAANLVVGVGAAAGTFSIVLGLS